MGHNSTFCYLKMQMRKKLYIFKHFAKSKKIIFLPISIILRVIPIEIPKKSIKLKPPKAHKSTSTNLVVLEGDGLARLGPLEGTVGAVVHLVEPVVRRCKPSL